MGHTCHKMTSDQRVHIFLFRSHCQNLFVLLPPVNIPPFFFMLETMMRARIERAQGHRGMFPPPRYSCDCRHMRMQAHAAQNAWKWKNSRRWCSMTPSNGWPRTKFLKLSSGRPLKPKLPKTNLPLQVRYLLKLRPFCKIVQNVEIVKCGALVPWMSMLYASDKKLQDAAVLVLRNLGDHLDTRMTISIAIRDFLVVSFLHVMMSKLRFP